MSNLEIVLKNKNIILPHFLEWVETFEPASFAFYSDEERFEQEVKDYYYMCQLADKLEVDDLNEEEADAIMFHVSQINHDEEVINLI
jgi:hypothetical protein